MIEANALPKNHVRDLACFGGNPLFAEAKSTSNLRQPDFDRYLRYSREFFERRHYTNNGYLVRRLEQRLAEFHQTGFCVTFCSGFWALALAMSSLALKGKSEVVMPSLTYRRLADVAAWVRLKPRFCEVDPATLAVNRQTVGDCVNSETALIVAVHPIVNCCDVEGVASLGKERGIPVLFDSVESMYESVPAGKVGRFGEAECFSMHASKLLNGFEGGYVVTDDTSLARRLALLRTYGFEGQDNCVIPGGLNAKLNEMHAAMALANLDELERLVDDNRRRYRTYQAGLADTPGVRILEFDETSATSYKNIVVELSSRWLLGRDETVAVLNAENILARSYYSPPLHQRKMSYPHVASALPTTDRLAQRFVLLPCGDFVTVDDIDGIVEFLKFIQSNGAEIARRLTAERRQ